MSTSNTDPKPYSNFNPDFQAFDKFLIQLMTAHAKECEQDDGADDANELLKFVLDHSSATGVKVESESNLICFNLSEVKKEANSAGYQCARNPELNRQLRNHPAFIESGQNKKIEGKSYKVMVFNYDKTIKAVEGIKPETNLSTKENLTNDDPKEVTFPKLNITYVTKTEDVTPALEKLVEHSTGEPYGCDIETAPLGNYAEEFQAARQRKKSKHTDPGLDPYKSEIKTIQVADNKGTALVFDINKLERIPTELVEFLETHPLVGHNFKFDIKHLLHSGVRVNDSHCTQLQNLILGDPEIVKDRTIRSSLQKLAKEKLGLNISKDAQTSDWSEETLTEKQIEYAAMDAYTALALYQAQKKEVEQRDATTSYNIARRVQLPTAKLELSGIKLDKDKHNNFIKTAKGVRDEAEAKLREYFGDTNFNSSQQLSDKIKELASEEEIANWPKTKSKKRVDGREVADLKTDANTLKERHHLSFIASLLKFREAEKKLSSFGQKFADLVHPETNRVHAQYNILGAASGRFTCSDPNMQQLVNDDDFLSSFVPETGNIFLSADASQMELRVCAEESSEPEMRRVYQEGGDLHRTTASKILGVPYEEVTQKQRQAAKAINFSIIYGSGAKGLAASAASGYGVEMSEGDAKNYLNEFRKAYPTFAKWEQDTRAKAKKRRYIQTRGGKVRRFDINHIKGNDQKALERLLYTAPVNTIIQGTSAEIQNLALVILEEKLQKEGLSAKIVNIVHDSITLEVPESEADNTAEILKRSMEAAFTHKKFYRNAPTLGYAEVKRGYSLAEVK